MIYIMRNGQARTKDLISIKKSNITYKTKHLTYPKSNFLITCNCYLCWFLSFLVGFIFVVAIARPFGKNKIRRIVAITGMEILNAIGAVLLLRILLAIDHVPLRFTASPGVVKCSAGLPANRPSFPRDLWLRARCSRAASEWQLGNRNGGRRRESGPRGTWLVTGGNGGVEQKYKYNVKAKIENNNKQVIQNAESNGPTNKMCWTHSRAFSGANAAIQSS